MAVVRHNALDLGKEKKSWELARKGKGKLGIYVMKLGKAKES